MNNKIVKTVILVILGTIILWSAMIIVDYTRCKNIKTPIFAISKFCNDDGSGVYNGLGYRVIAYTEGGNGGQLGEMQKMDFTLFGRGRPETRVADYFDKLYSLVGEDKERIVQLFSEMERNEPKTQGKQEIYEFPCNINDDEIIIKLVFYNNVFSAYQLDFKDTSSAYKYAKKMRVDLEKTLGEKSTYPGITQTNTDYFDNIKNVSELKNQYKYYEDWTPVVAKENTIVDEKQIMKIIGDKKYSRVDLRFELNIIGENNANVSLKYVIVP